VQQLTKVTLGYSAQFSNLHFNTRHIPLLCHPTVREDKVLKLKFATLNSQLIVYRPGGWTPLSLRPFNRIFCLRRMLYSRGAGYSDGASAAGQQPPRKRDLPTNDFITRFRWRRTQDLSGALAIGSLGGFQMIEMHHSPFLPGVTPNWPIVLDSVNHFDAFPRASARPDKFHTPAPPGFLV